MAFTPSGWIPSLGPLAGCQVPERSCLGAAAELDFWLLAAACCGFARAPSTKDDNISAGAAMIIRILVIPTAAFLPKRAPAHQMPWRESLQSFVTSRSPVEPARTA